MLPVRWLALLALGLVLVAPGCRSSGGDQDFHIDDDYHTGNDDDVGDDDTGGDDDQTGDDDTGDDSEGDDDSESDDDQTDDDDTTPLTVALLDTGSSGIGPIDAALTAEGHTVELMELGDAPGLIGDSHDLLIYPGGSDGVWAVIDDPTLGNAVRSFVDSGRGFVGICGGAIAGSADLNYNGTFLPGMMIGLLDVEATWYDAWNAYVGNMAELQFQVAMEHEILGNVVAGDPMAGDYAGGPAFTTASEDILLTYAQGLDPGLDGHAISGMGALSAGQYGAGRVILSAIHPEYNHPDLLLAYVDWVRP